jgi:hypothetical protein
MSNMDRAPDLSFVDMLLALRYGEDFLFSSEA